jgi:hypothetical protein
MFESLLHKIEMDLSMPEECNYNINTVNSENNNAVDHIIEKE